MTREFLIETTKGGWNIINEQVGAIVEQSGVQNGLCLLYVPHTTAGLVVTSHWDLKGVQDSLDDLKAVYPTRMSYKHPYSPYAGAARSKTAVVGCERTLIIKDGKLLLGHSQSLMVYEFDGPQTRKVVVTVLDKPLYFGTYAFRSEYGSMTDVTEEVEKIVAESGVENGSCHITDVAATSSILLCEGDEAVQNDIWEDIERMIPTRADFGHRETASDAGGHTKTFVGGTQIQLPVVDGKLVRAENQRIVYAEFDGPRPRDVKVAVYND